MGIKEKAKGIWNEAVGETKEQVGKLINNPELEAKGHMQEFKGKAEREVEKVREEFSRIKKGDDDSSPACP